MRIDFKNGHITIDDNSEEAKKIKQGHNYSIKDGKIKIGKKPIKPQNKYQLRKKLEETNNFQDFKKYFLEIIDKLI